MKTTHHEKKNDKLPTFRNEITNFSERITYYSERKKKDVEKRFIYALHKSFTNFSKRNYQLFGTKINNAPACFIHAV